MVHIIDGVEFSDEKIKKIIEDYEDRQIEDDSEEKKDEVKDETKGTIGVQEDTKDIDEGLAIWSDGGTPVLGIWDYQKSSKNLKRLKREDSYPWE